MTVVEVCDEIHVKWFDHDDQIQEDYFPKEALRLY